MASESLLGAGGTTLPSTAVKVLDKFLTDSIPSSKIVADAGNGSSIIVSSGSKGDINIVITPPTTGNSGSLSEGAGKTLNFQLTPNTGLVSKSTNATDTGVASNYVASILDNYIPPSGATPLATAQKASLIGALQQILTALSTTGSGAVLSNFLIRTIDFFSSTSGPSEGKLTDDGQQAFALLDSDGSYQGIDSLVGANEILLDAGTSSGSQLFVINLSGIGGKTLALQNVEGAVLGAAGTVRVEGSGPIKISSDNQAQNITGGGGNDTLIGTGSDTLTGGSGNDVFGFSGIGKYTVTDFNTAGDMLAFNIAGVTTLDQLKAQVTSVVKTSSAITYNLGPDTSITLIGVSAADLTAAMLKYTISG
jgi:hypothetical protein